MKYSHDVDENSSFELMRVERHILAHTSHPTRKARLPMFKAYPLYLAPRNERGSSNRGIVASFFGFLFGAR
jgi:hypothetical protein